jgi:DNA phosphorothioation-dependent restriction protein DptH
VYCLKEFGISIKGYPELTNIGPASVTFKFKPASGVPTSKIEGKIDDLKLILELEHNQEINLYSDKGFINLVVPKKSEDREFFKWEELKIDEDLIVENLILPFGFDNNRNVTSINFSYDNSPHLLIGGQTGSGKSVALTTILKSAVSLYDASRLQLVLVDPKGTELLEFEESPHLQNPIAEGKIGLDSDDAICYINACIKEMASRYDRMKNMRVNNILKFNQKVSKEEQLPWILMVLDEYGELTADKSVRGNLESLLQRLAQKARACGIHLIITTQKPSNEVLSTIIRSNLPAQIALKVRSATDSKIVLSDQTGAEKLYGKGDALFNNGSIISRVQIAQ